MQFLRTQSAETVTALLQTKVFPLYAMVSPTPYVLANANWLLGELAFCLPEVSKFFSFLQGSSIVESLGL
jgi:hypothetical protein